MLFAARHEVPLWHTPTVRGIAQVSQLSGVNFDVVNKSTRMRDVAE